MRFRMTVSLIGVALIDLLFCSQPLWALKIGPYLQDVTQTSIKILWDETYAENWQIRYGPDADHLQAGPAPTPKQGSIVMVSLTDLKPNTEYSYKLVSTNAETPLYHFSTAVDKATPFRFIAYGDNRTDGAPQTRPDFPDQSGHIAVAKAIAAVGPRFVLNSGDLIENGYSLAQWENFFQVEKEVVGNAPFYSVFANHELEGGEIFFRTYFSPPPGSGDPTYFAFPYGNSIFIGLNVVAPSGFYEPGSAQYRFFEQTLLDAHKNPDIDHIFVFFHYPPYSASGHGSTLPVRELLGPLFEKYDVDMVISGHNHLYERHEVNQITYLVTGGGGAPLYTASTDETTILSESTYHYCVIDLNGRDVKVNVFRPDNSLLDTFTFNHSIKDHEVPSRSCAGVVFPTHADWRLGLGPLFLLLASIGILARPKRD
jgi:hypothetical protein